VAEAVTGATGVDGGLSIGEGGRSEDRFGGLMKVLSGAGAGDAGDAALVVSMTLLLSERVNLSRNGGLGGGAELGDDAAED